MFDGAISDIRAGWSKRPLWLALAREDIGDAHKRTALGPIWLLLNYFALAGTFIFVMQRGEGEENYGSYVAIGLLVWFFIMESITQSVSLFSRMEGFIKGTPLPLSVYVMRQATQSLIRASYAAVGCLIILAFSGLTPSPVWLWSIVGIVIVLVATPGAIILFAFIGVIFPDSRFLVSNVMRVGMFLTPVFWVHHPGDGGVRGVFYYYNPFTYFLEIVRTPIIKGEIQPWHYLLCLAIGLVVWCVSLLLLDRFRKRIVFLL